jgi:hypothetical protein
MIIEKNIYEKLTVVHLGQFISLSPLLLITIYILLKLEF